MKGQLRVKMSRATHFVGTADLPQSKRTRRAGGRRFRVGPIRDIRGLGMDRSTLSSQLKL